MKHIVIDLEMNPIKNPEARRICRNEIVEIGAIMLDDDLHEVSSFKTYVRPEYNGIASKITRLTGITDEMVNMAPKFEEAVKEFTDWCLAAQDEVKIYAWSDNDFNQITKEMRLKNYTVSALEEPLLTKDWDDFQHEFDSYLGFNKLVSLKQALEYAGIDFEGKEHDALDDARNTAELFNVFRDKDLRERTLNKIKEVLTPKKNICTLGEMIDFSAFECA